MPTMIRAVIGHQERAAGCGLIKLVGEGKLLEAQRLEQRWPTFGHRNARKRTGVCNGIESYLAAI